MPNIMAGSLNGRFPELSTSRLEIMSLVINRVCNLTCKHCYLNSMKLGQDLTSNEWMKFLFSTLSDLRPSIICFAGKEIFANPGSVDILVSTLKIRNRLQAGLSRKTEMGVITNGTLLDRYTSPIQETPPDYFDISIDGLPETHNKIRGKGAFERLEPNLRWLMRSFQGNIWLTHTIFENNLKHLPQFIEFYNMKYGIAKFSIGFYKILSHTDHRLELGVERYRQFVSEILTSLTVTSLRTSVDVVLEFDSNQSRLIQLLEAHGWVKSKEQICSTKYSYANGLNLQFNISKVPVGLWRSVRVSPEGFWIAAEDLFKVNEYSKVAAGKVKECDCNAKMLYLQGLKSDRFREIYVSYDSMPQNHSQLSLEDEHEYNEAA